MKNRCLWAKNELDILYHDNEWCRPTHNEREFFEYLVLEGMQAGLSWSLILKKRENFKRAFNNFDYKICANYSDEYLENLRQDESIIRNKLKIYSVRKNARAFLEIQKEFGTFDNYIWKFSDYKTIQNNFNNSSEVPSTSDLSDKISRDMKKRGFTFVGSTIIYSFMQAIGMLNDHTGECFCYKECSKN
ncbi:MULTISPECIES: DNA-3-methyladenine glycosylase I [Gemella]|uniref:DNA-3-methyladenine glycosylase I n=1 Tax=Gemella TaxID=1378 RepID=UPI000768219A|nr:MULTISPECIES: DNA-3-methyladenine glycosylase I [Gemella]AME09253.1 3-methyladenine DNA glycosylase [Gemella sp. oral taxon 928]AXI26886.1 DNA-3-methyladenine glycosylase I [Gemella sp. ND 6198]